MGTAKRRSRFPLRHDPAQQRSKHRPGPIRFHRRTPNRHHRQPPDLGIGPTLSGHVWYLCRSPWQGLTRRCHRRRACLQIRCRQNHGKGRSSPGHHHLQPEPTLEDGGRNPARHDPGRNAGAPARLCGTPDLLGPGTIAGARHSKP